MSVEIVLTFDRIAATTDKAVLYDFGGVEVWIPKSVSGEPFQSKVSVQEWFAIQEGIEVYES